MVLNIQPIVDIWQNNWSNIITFFQYPADIRKVIYTTNIIESANRQIRKVIKTKSSFPNDMAVYKIVFLCLQNVTKKWTMPIRDWTLALSQFAILFKNRMPKN